MISIIMLYALYGSSFVISKILLNNYTSPIFLAGARMTLAGAILLCYQYFYAREHFKFRWKHVKYYVQIILLGIYANYILRFWALKSLTAPKAAFILCLAPFFSSIFSYYFFNEKLSRRQWFGLFVGFTGSIPILLTTSTTEQLFGEIAFISLPELAMILAAACTSYSWIIMRKLVRHKNYSPTMANGLTMFSGGLLALFTAIPLEGALPVKNPLPFFGWLMLIIIISNVICRNIYTHLLKQYTATFMSFAAFLSPLFTALYSWLFLGETVTWHFYLSSAMVLFGLYIFYKDELNGQTALVDKAAK